MDFKSMLYESMSAPDVGDRLFLLKDTEFSDVHDFYSMKMLGSKKFKSGSEFIVMDFEGKICELKPKDANVIVNIPSSELKKHFKE